MLASAMWGGSVALASPPSTAHASRAGLLRLLHGIPQSGSRLGHANAGVSVTLYSDLECPICREFVIGHVFAWLVRDEVRPGRVQITYRSFRTASPTTSAFRTQEVAAFAAGRQDRLWQFAAIFLLDQGQEGTDYVNEQFLDMVARQVPNLELAQWRRARTSSKLGREVQRDHRAAGQHGIDATPSFVVRGPHGVTRTISGLPTRQQLARAIAAVS